MADVDLSTEAIDRDGLAATYTGSLSVSDTYKVKNDGKTFLHFKKTGAGACTVTVATPKTVGDYAVADATITVPATTGDVMAGAWPTEIFNDGEGELSFTLSEITGLSVAVVRLNPVA